MFSADTAKPFGPTPARGGRKSRQTTALIVGSLVLLVLAVVATARIYPPLAAAVCPGCYGLRAAGSNIFVEQSASPAAQDRAVATVLAARERVGRFYGPLTSRPRILMCLTAPCYQRIGGGGSSGMALLDFALLLSPRGGTVVIASHEISHIELHQRIGRIATITRAIPQWFDEGLAVLVSSDPRYLKPVGSADRCILSSSDNLPTSRAAWVVTARSQALYAKAGCRVSRWVSANGGEDAIRALAQDIRAGRHFDQLVR